MRYVNRLQETICVRIDRGCWHPVDAPGGDHLGGLPDVTEGAPLSFVWWRHEPHRAPHGSTSSVALGAVAMVLQVRMGRRR